MCCANRTLWGNLCQRFVSVKGLCETWKEQCSKHVTPYDKTKKRISCVVVDQSGDCPVFYSGEPAHCSIKSQAPGEQHPDSQHLRHQPGHHHGLGLWRPFRLHRFQGGSSQHTQWLDTSIDSRVPCFVGEIIGDCADLVVSTRFLFLGGFNMLCLIFIVILLMTYLLLMVFVYPCSLLFDSSSL